MQPPKPDSRKLTEIRVTRKTNTEVLAATDSHGWAVSYADLLMVLLSFFVLYFNFSESTVESELQKIAMSMQGLGAKEMEAARKPDSFTSLEAALSIEGVKVTQKQDYLLVELQNGAFGPGRFALGSTLRDEVDKVSERLLPFKDKVALTVIGHADKKPLIRQNKYLQDNFDLSSLRALQVLKYVIAKGFPENQASARAASSFDRDARSVTIEIRLAQSQKAEGSS